ncbi:MAG: universal stress protein [Deltaproteobacteria bacterium]|nr:universal stress protein [Deltaproteobacteria bacterium]
MEKILVPVDGSEQSHKAVGFAVDLANHYHATIYLLHVFKLTIVPEGLGEYVEGDPAERIIDYAKEHDVDIIVIGSRGLGTFKGLLLGSVSNKVTHRADRTCVIVR